MLNKILKDIDTAALDAKTRDQIQKIDGQKSVSPEDIETVLAARRVSLKARPQGLDAVESKLRELQAAARGPR